MRFWIDIGRDDAWASVAESFHQLMQSAGVEHSFHIFSGGHVDEYWAAHVPEYLRFYGEAWR